MDSLLAVGSAAAFGGWTLVANATTFLGAPFAWAARALPLCLILGLAVALRLSERTTHSDADPGASHDPLFIVAGVAAAIAYALVGSYPLWWVVAMTIAIAGLWRSRDSQAAYAAADYRWAIGVQLTMALAAVVLTLGLHRGDIDDAFYLSVAHQALAHPEAAPLASDAMYGVPGRPLLMDLYRIGAYELMIAAIAWWTGRPVFDVAYLYLPALTALVAIAAWSALLRDLVGRIWPIALVAAMVLLVANGEPARSLANFAFVRLFQGKAVFVTAALPALVFIVNRALGTDGVGWRIAANLALVGGVGLTAWGLIAAPFIVAVAALASAIGGRLEFRRIAILAPALAYCALVSVAIRPEVVLPEALTTFRWTTDLAVRTVFGVVAPFMLFAISTAWACLPRRRMARTWLASAAVAVLAVPLNPWLAEPIARAVTTVPVFWRVFWLLPFLVFPIVVIARSIALASTEGPVERFAFGAVAATMMLAALAPATTLSAHGVAFHWPRPKIAPAEFQVARTIQREFPATTKLVAPDAVAAVLASFDRHPELIVVRRHYLDLCRGCFDRDDLEARSAIARMLAMPPESAFDPAPVAFIIDRHRPSAFVVRADSPLRGEFASYLESRGFRPRAEDGYEIWSVARRE